MGMASGESNIYFGTDVGKWDGIIFGLPEAGGGLPHVYILKFFSDFCGEFKCG